MTTTLTDLAQKFNQSQFQKLNEELSFQDYLDKVVAKPKLAYSAYQRLYSMIVAKGYSTETRYRKTFKSYNFFKDANIPIFGLENTIDDLMKHVHGGANWYGAEKRILLLSGPVGSSKSTICRLLKRGMEEYSKTDEGAVYTYEWKNLGDLDIKSAMKCPMNDDPLKLIPAGKMRNDFISILQNRLEQDTPDEESDSILPLKITGDLNPQCKFYMDSLLREYKGDWQKVVEKHIVVKRFLISESNRQGIGTFQPKDPKNQDATELTGDVNYMKLGHYGVDSDPRAFSFDGEFEIANRGVLEFIEIFKLEKEFLYDLLGVCQERQFKPKKFSQIDVDMVLIGHSNMPELEKLRADNTMEAIRDRTVKIDVPYLLEWSKEISVLKQDYNKEKVRRHIAPHTVEISALFAVLTRLKRENNITLVEKAKLYDGQSMTGYTQDNVKEMRDKHRTEGMDVGISARFVQNAISNALVSGRKDYINPFMVLSELKVKVSEMLNVKDEEQRSHYNSCLTEARKELDQRLKEEVQKALVGDNNAIVRLFEAYMDNVTAFIDKSKVADPLTGEDMQPNERLMREIEEKADVPDANAPDFRRQIAQFMYTESRKTNGKKMSWDSNHRLKEALEKKLFEDVKDTIKLAKLSSNASMVDKDLQNKIDSIKARLVRDFGYIEESAADVLNYVSTIFARNEDASDE
jgi:serine protein kinase